MLRLAAGPSAASRLGLLALLGASLGAGCKSPRTSALPENPTWFQRPAWALRVAERRPLTAPSEVQGEDHERGQPTVDAKNRRLFVGSSDRGLYALRAEDLSTIWRFQTASFVQCEPLYDEAEDTVYFGSNDGALYKVKAHDGSLLWRFSTNAEVARKPVVAGGIAYFINANDTAVAVDATTGKLRWSYHRTPAYGMEIAGHAGVTLHEDKVITAFSDGHVIALGANNGKEVWAYDLSAEAESSGGEEPVRYLDSDATPVLARTREASAAFVASYEGGVFALDTETGSLLWRREEARGVTELALWEEPAHAPRNGGPAVPARRMLLGSSGVTGLWAFSLEDGRPLWRQPLPEGGISRPVAWSGALFLSSTRYGLFLLSPRDGSVIDGIDTGNGFAMAPAAHGQRAFVMSNQGVLFALQLQPPGANGSGPEGLLTQGLAGR
ncbi:MAG: PQQ-binding-like beta-propeller repeat protein [Polyangiaceae bacterium]|nr:PQQ-binding-like beta-propeller repeat protein [Polyangiaceae bacterium]